MGPYEIVSCLPIGAPNSPEGDYVRYGPIYQINCVFCPSALRATAGHQVDLEGFEPSTSSVRLRRAPKLRYRPIFQGDDDFT